MWKLIDRRSAFRSGLPAILLALAVGWPVVTCAGQMHTELERLDLPALVAANRPDWRVPGPLQAERGPVIAEELLAQLESGHFVHGKYLWTDGQWHWLGVRVRGPSFSDKEQPSVRRLGRGRYRDLSLEALRSGDGVPVAGRAGSPCKDDPATRAPARSLSAPQEKNISDLEVVARWSDSSAPCSYRAEFRYVDGSGEQAWSLVEFEYTLTGDVVGNLP